MKVPSIENSWNFKNPTNHGVLVNNLTKPPVARKLAVFWPLVVSSLNYFKMHAWSTCMLFLLHSTLMLCMVKVKGCALNCHSHRITSFIMENHDIVFLNFCENPVICIVTIILCSSATVLISFRHYMFLTLN